MLSYFGVDASGYSFAYLVGWAEKKDVVGAVLSNIQNTAGQIVDAVQLML